MITSYDSMPYGIYLRLLDINEDKDRSELDKQVAMVAALDGKTEAEVLDLPLEEFRERTAALEFLGRPTRQPEATGTFPERITLGNGMTCTVLRDVTKINTAQFVDFQQLAQQGRAGTPGILALMIVPVGKVYGHTGENDPLAYDVEAVRRAILEDLTVTQVNRLAAFFLREWTNSLTRSLTSLRDRAAKEGDPTGKLALSIAQVDRLLIEIPSSVPGAGSTQ